MPDRPPFPIPDEIDPPKMCLQLCIPDDPTWKAVIAGLLDELNQWYNWQRDDARSGKELAQVWRKLYAGIDWSNMSCCCPEPTPLMIRFTDEGHYQTSDDGGTTWVDSPTLDPRYSSPLFPPVLPPDVVEPDCTYADSIVNMMKVQFVEAVETGDTVTAIAAVLAGIIGALAGPFAWAVIYVIAAALFPAIIAFTVDAWQAAFTTDLWDRLRCNLQMNMGTDGSFSTAQTDAVYSELSTTETGIALFTLQRVIATFGSVGLTNAARSGLGASDAECDCAPVGCEPEIWELFPDFIALGQTISYGVDYFEVDTVFAGSDHYVIVKTNDIANCCYIVSVEATGGAIASNHGYTDCNNAVSEYVPQYTGGAGYGTCANHIYLTFSVATTVRVYVGACL